MTSYAPVASTNVVMRGQQAVADDHFVENGGVRREWWWEDGPVDSCCFCCTLRIGVGLLAGNNLFRSIGTLALANLFFFPIVSRELEIYEQRYSSECQDPAPYTVHCEGLNESIGQRKAAIIETTAILYVTALANITAGVVGLWAVRCCNSRAAKAYMLSVPALFLLGILAEILLQHAASASIVGLITGGTNWLWRVFEILPLLYYFKVCWSYYTRSFDHQENAHSSVSSNYKVTRDHEESARGGVSSNAEDNAEDPEHPMIAMNTIA